MMLDRNQIRACFKKHKGCATKVAEEIGCSRSRVVDLCQDLREAYPTKSVNGYTKGGKAASFDKVASRLRKSGMTLEQISDVSGFPKLRCEKWIESQINVGLNIQRFGDLYIIDKEIRPSFDAPMLQLTSDKHNRFKIGAMGDTHLCSKYERLDVLNDLYDLYQNRGVEHVFHAGNWIDGEASFNRMDLHTHGMEAQIDYLVRNYPRKKGITTHAITGADHEGWYAKQMGIDIGRRCEQTFRDHDRKDWYNLGYMEAYVRLVNTNTGSSAILCVMHPGGGSAYATSYTVQKIVESFGGGEKPAVLLAGHYHKMEQINIRNVWCVQTGCTQDQTPFMRQKKIEAHVGGHVLDLVQDPETGAIIEMNGQRRYFTTGYYNHRWSHSGPVNLPDRKLGGLSKS